MTQPRFLVVAMPSPINRAALKSALEISGLKARLDGAMFDPANWHQSLQHQLLGAIRPSDPLDPPDPVDHRRVLPGRRTPGGRPR